MESKKKPVSERALIARINRRLKRERPYEMLHKYSGERWRGDLGSYYVVDHNRNAIGDRRIEDLEAYAREWGALADYEELRKE